MGKFILGVIVTLICIAIGTMAYTRLGYAPVAADEPVGSVEKFVLGGSLDPSVEHHAQHVDSPVPVNDANLIEGMKVYQMNCADCHGGMDQQTAAMGQAMFPKAPQLVKRGSHDPGWFTFYEIDHGIRRTGMPSWNKLLTSDQIWKTVLFLQNVKKLPPAVQQAWDQSRASGEAEEHEHHHEAPPQPPQPPKK